MVLSSSLYRQGGAIRQKLEAEKLETDRRIKELEEKVSTLEKKLEEERTARKKADKASAKTKRELEREQEVHEKELGALTSRSRDVMEHYRKCLRSAGADTEFLGECTMDEFMVWLQGEMDALDGHMMLGRDFAAITAFKATGHSLVDAGCTHLSELTIKESSYYWQTPSEAKALGKRFLEEFWHAGGNEMAIMQGTCSRG
jgi:outer membrane murein-binding lipoprotein Lpp